MVGPDWDDNPPELDTPEEVRSSLMDSGLDPVDVDTAPKASEGHAIVHAFAADDDLGGRTPAQLEAEHDMAVDAMVNDFGFNHETELDLMDLE